MQVQAKHSTTISHYWTAWVCVCVWGVVVGGGGWGMEKDKWTAAVALKGRFLITATLNQSKCHNFRLIRATHLEARAEMM